MARYCYSIIIRETRHGRGVPLIARVCLLLKIAQARSRWHIEIASWKISVACILNAFKNIKLTHVFLIARKRLCRHSGWLYTMAL